MARTPHRRSRALPASARRPVALALVAGLAAGATWGVSRWAYARRAERRTDRRRLEVAAAVTAERTRIARELHDVVAHTVTVMLLQAAGASRLARADPGAGEAAARALELIEQQGKLAMAELRRLLAVLQVEERPGDELLGVEDLDALVQRMRRAGVEVALEVVGQPRPLSPGVGMAVHRLVEEALTNVGKHAGDPAPTVVRLIWSDELFVEVANDGPDGPSPLPIGTVVGHGLLGLRERIALTGGRLEAGATPGGGFRVAALIPLRDAATPEPGRLP